MIYVIIFLVIVIGFLGYKLYVKQALDRKQLEDLEASIKHNKDIEDALKGKLLDLQIRCNDARNERMCEETRTESLKEAAEEALQRYHDIVDVKMKELDDSLENYRMSRQTALDQELNEKQELYDEIAQNKQKEAQDICRVAEELIKKTHDDTNEQLAQLWATVSYETEKYEGIHKTLMTYEMERQAKAFYTLQIPEEYHDDIEFLLTTVAAKVAHPDILSKLVWTEYIKPAFDELVKRIGIKAEPGIYKITNIDTGKCYIGKSTDVKKRLSDHCKGAIGINSIADQAIHHAMLKEGLWNWSIEIIIYAEKDKLSELEKYYIEFFKSQEFGYNKQAGG